jgi:hypothetical protein
MWKRWTVVSCNISRWRRKETRGEKKRSLKFGTEAMDCVLWVSALWALRRAFWKHHRMDSAAGPGGWEPTAISARNGESLAVIYGYILGEACTLLPP